MADILSQSEIDSLLSALSSGEIDASDIKEETKENKIKKYDFKSPKKLAKDQLKTLHMIHENFSRILNTYLSGYLRTITQIDVISVEELSYYEFNNSISNPALISVIDFMPLPGQIIFEMSNRLAFTMIDRILGGNGKYESESRPFTEIETTILNKLMANVSRLLIEPWENVIELDPELDKIETNSQFAQIVSSNETVALITLRANIGEIEGLMNICMPHIVLEPILPNLSTKFWFSTVKKELNEEDKGYLETRVKRANIDINAIVGDTYITVEEFIYLQEGDVIKLSRKIDEDLELHVEGKTKYLGRPGTLKNNMAFKITKVVEKGDEDYDE